MFPDNKSVCENPASYDGRNRPVASSRDSWLDPAKCRCVACSEASHSLAGKNDPSEAIITLRVRSRA